MIRSGSNAAVKLYQVFGMEFLLLGILLSIHEPPSPPPKKKKKKKKKEALIMVG